ncbi:MAG: hypothetical protein AB8E82_04910 [Aureispira sp.]
MKKSIIIGGILLLLLGVLPYSMQLYGRKQLAVSLEQPVFDLVGYQKGWNWLEYVQYFPFWKSETKKYQKCGLLEAKMRFFEARIDCQKEAEEMLKMWADKHDNHVSMSQRPLAPYIPEESLSWQLLYWKASVISLDSLSEQLQEQIVIFSDHYCVNNRKKWQPFVDWAEEREIDLAFQDSILSSHALHRPFFQLKLDYNVNYLAKEYSLW